MHRAAVLQVADHRDDFAGQVQIGQLRLLVDRVEIQQRLGRVLTDAIA